MALAPSSRSSSPSRSAHFAEAECTTSNYEELPIHKSVPFMDGLQRKEGRSQSMALAPSSRSSSPSRSAHFAEAECTTSNYEELPIHKSVPFMDGLQGLKKLRTQLYSAAEYFEFSYTNGEQKQIVADTLKDYTVKALVNTVDHLGSMSYKVNGFLNENMTDVSSAEIQMDCLQQRIQTCQAFTDRGGLAQQSLSIEYPRYHRHYVLPTDKLHAYSKAVEVSRLVTMEKINDVQPLQAGINAIRSNVIYSGARSTERPITIPKHSIPPSPRMCSSSPSQRTGTFGPAEKMIGNSLAATHPLARSVSQKQTARNDLSSNSVKRWPSHSRRTTSMQSADSDSMKENEEQYRKSRSLLKSLLSIRRSSVEHP